jgi:DNA-3-methyladenine glycosylase I
MVFQRPLLLLEYHDKEWGVPIHDDDNNNRLFEFLILEGAQAGLSSLTILRKRENYRKAFDHFDPKRISKIRRLQDKRATAGFRHRAKQALGAAIQNAGCALEVNEEFDSLDKYLLELCKRPKAQGKPLEKFEPDPRENQRIWFDESGFAQAWFRFVGSTTCYSFMQATGMVNDHETSCFRHSRASGG